jgi:hypothetical protein
MLFESFFSCGESIFIPIYFRVWNDTAIPFKDVLQEFEQWLACHNLWEKVKGGPLNKAAFVTWLVTL